MSNSKILITISRVLLPFLILFGIYIIINGDTSVGGGFQGGVVLASSYLLYYFIKGDHPFTISGLLKVDKLLFVMLPIVVIIGFLSRGEFFTNMFPFSVDYEIRRLYLLILNLLIGSKVSIGFVSLFQIFIEEGTS